MFGEAHHNDTARMARYAGPGSGQMAADAAEKSKRKAKRRRERKDIDPFATLSSDVADKRLATRVSRDLARANLARAYADVRDGEVWLVGAHISTYDQGNIANHDPDRDRKLLLHRKEIASLYGKVRERGLTLVPTKLYFKDGRAKVELALARGKETRDKRRDIARREADRQIERALKSRRS